MFKAAKLSQDLSVTKSCFECSFWIRSVTQTASKNQEKGSNFDVDTELLSYCMDIKIMSQMKGSLFQPDTQYKALKGEHTPH